MKPGSTILLAVAAALLATAVCQAQDSPFRKALKGDDDRDRVCAIHGTGFFRVRGTDVCVKVGGSVTYEYSVHR